MSKNNGGWAFPGSESLSGVIYDGMTMRQYYKAVALQGLLATNQYAFYGEDLEANIKSCGDIADAMIAEDEEAAKNE